VGREVRIGTASAVFDDFLRPSRYKALYGGRGSGKSHFFAEAMVANAASNTGFRAVCIREVQKSLKESAKRLIEDKVRQFDLGAFFDPRVDCVTCPGDGVILFQGMQDHTAESIKSLEGMNVAWAEEGQTLSLRSLEMLRPTIRAPRSEIWASWNPRNANDPVDGFFRGDNAPENAVIRKINYDQNRFFPSELEEERLHDEKFNRDRYAHIWLGEYEPMAVGAIWDRQTIHQHRRAEAPPMKRIVVAVDPAVSAEAGSNEHGIVVAGIGDDTRGYVLDDCSTQGSPRAWADRAVATYDRYDADCIVIERNQGGDMCRFTLNSVRPGLRIIEVVATRGKHVRAEPISALYHLGRVSHVGTFPQLEDQMCRMTAAGYEGEGSPDRVDALVWGLTELFPQMVRPKTQPIVMPRMGEGAWMA
jgi:phage terminase large subunit-like protein